MDSLHAIGFYVSAALAGAGGALIAFTSRPGRRGAGMAVFGLGVAGVYASLSAGFAGVIVLVCYGACAVLLARPDYRTVEQLSSALWRQLGALGAALLFIALAYAAYRGSVASAAFHGATFNTAPVGRLLFTHDAAATVAVGGIVLAGLLGAALAWRRDRSRDERGERR